MSHIVNKNRLGATRLPDGRWQFLVWAPKTRSVDIHLVGIEEKIIPMDPLERGYYRAIAENIEPDAQYRYRLEDGRELPDPASRSQPKGVHGLSQMVDTGAFRWSDQEWKGRDLASSIFYELHVGTFTQEGAFEGVMEKLPYLTALGVTTIELMPIAQFPGSRNWGYDGVYPFAPQTSYGSPASLQLLIDAAHRHGLAVALDVVYNHLGPEGNYLSAFGPYFTDRYRTPWGEALNYDGAGSEGVRAFFIQNALYWLEEYHFDALRLDAIHGIFDFGAQHFLAELKLEVAKLGERTGRRLHLIAESDLNDSRILHDQEYGGYGLDAQWSDDFHHSVHTLLTKENRGYYADFEGIDPLIATLKNGWAYDGQYSEYRQRRHGNSARGLRSSSFVVCNQNHDQIGNRAAGDRLSAQLSLEGLKLAAAVTLLSPFVPLLFMGEEYGEIAPFQYFTSHGDSALVEAVRKGRREEFAAFGWEESVPDPQDEGTFFRSRLDPSQFDSSRLDLSPLQKEHHGTMLKFYQRLIAIRKEYGVGEATGRTVERMGDRAVLLAYERVDCPLAVLFNFADVPVAIQSLLLTGEWRVVLNSASPQWGGPENETASKILFGQAIEPQLAPQSVLVLAPAHATSEKE